MVIYKNNAEKYPTLQHMLTCSDLSSPYRNSLKSMWIMIINMCSDLDVLRSVCVE